MIGGGVVRLVGTGLRSLVPLVTLLAAMTVDMLPLASLAPGGVVPAFTLLVAFYWCLHRPDLLTAFDLFAAGLAVDLAAGAPIGSSSALLLLLRRLVVAPQRAAISRLFLSSWVAFAAILAIVEAARWLLMGIVHVALFPVLPLISETIVTVAIFPLGAVVLGWIGRTQGGEGHAPGS